jgi:signal transduction histidine kinase
MSTISPPDETRFLLSTLPAGRSQKRLALAFASGLVVALLATAPFAKLPLEGTAPLLPAYAAAVLVNELITASLLFAMFSVQRSRGLLVLAAAYLFSGLMVIPWGLTFPGVFSAPGLLDAGLQTTATIAAARRIGFPLLLLAYALLRDRHAPQADPRASLYRRLAITFAAVVVIVCAITLLSVAADPLLPRWMADARHVADAWHYVPPIAMALCFASAALLLWSRPLSLLDLWLLVVLLSAVIEILLLAYLAAGGRFSLGWWAGRVYGLTSSSIVLLVLLSETVTLYARLARSLMAERRSREARLTTLEMLSASIAHEVNQPLGSMVTNADAALRWLDRSQPDYGEVRQGLRRIAEDGHRAGKVIESVRTLFRKERHDRSSLDLNAVIAEAVQRAADESRSERLSFQTDLAPALPSVAGDALQLEQVIANLVANAIDAMSADSGRPRVLRVATGLSGPETVQVSVEDSGPGLSAQARQHLFEPFFTTKPRGMGMGLLFCRSIVEGHGGRLWADDSTAGGAIFRFTLPADDGGA